MSVRRKEARTKSACLEELFMTNRRYLNISILCLVVLLFVCYGLPYVARCVRTSQDERYWEYSVTDRDLRRMTPDLPLSVKLVRGIKAANIGEGILVKVELDKKDVGQLVKCVNSWGGKVEVSRSSRLGIYSIGPTWYDPDSARKFIAAKADNPNRSCCMAKFSAVIDISDPTHVVAYLDYWEG